LRNSFLKIAVLKRVKINSNKVFILLEEK
jgi:hypothetical protein